MSEKGEFKITYSALTAPAEEIHRSFEEAVGEVRRDLGKTHPIWIDGKPIMNRETFDNRSPADTSVLIGKFQRATREDAGAAIDAAHRAFYDWSHTPWRERLVMLRRAADNISNRRFPLAALMSLEAGKARSEALADVEESADLIRYYCQQFEDAEGFDRSMGQLSPDEKTRDLLRPYGVWVVISPFNFPLALAAGMTAGALVTGNTVVYKPASDTPASGLELHNVYQEAGLPAGVVNLITGLGSTLGDELVENPRVSGLVFTGSKDVGFHIYRKFNQGIPRPCILELGGKNPAIVTAKADLEKAADGVVRAAFGYGGQKCSACSRVYVEAPVAERFKELLIEKSRAVKVGDPLERETFLGPLINETACRNFESYVDEAKRDGAILCGGELLTEEPLNKGYFVAPTVAELPLDHRLFYDELFVPLLSLGEVGSLDEAIELSNRADYGLTGGIFSEDPNEVATFFDRIEVGVAYANRRGGATTGAWPGVNPFCGWKASGSSGKGVCGPYYVQQFLREQSHTVME